MKKRKKQIGFWVFLALFGVIFFWNGKETQAAEKKVMILQVQDQYQTRTFDVYADEYGDGYFTFSLEKEDIDVLKKNQKDQIQIRVTVVDSMIHTATLAYAPSLVLEGKESKYQEVSFEYQSGDEIRNGYFSYTLCPFEAGVSVDSLILSATSKGFHPSSGNSLPIRSMMTVQRDSYDGSTVSLRIRVNNQAGKYVFQKTYPNLSGSGSVSLNYKWSGKASKNNQAKAKAGAYVKSGTYQVEICLTYKGKGYVKTAVKRKKLVISKKAPAGKKGVAQAKKIPIFTGYANIDYMAEKMIQAAGVKSGMSQDQKVKKIYHYMTVKFKHTHYYEGGNFKVYYNLNKLKSGINSYKRQTDQKIRQGKLIYDYNAGYSTEYCMQRRIGVCDDHAQIFAILCKHVGVEAGVCSGYYKNRNGSLAGHAWNYAVINGNTYYYDVDIEIQNYKRGQGDYYWYKKTRAQANKTHKFR